jgi:hypothetical protein
VRGGESVIERADDRAPQPVGGKRQPSFVALPTAGGNGNRDGLLKRVRHLAQMAKTGAQTVRVIAAVHDALTMPVGA